MKFRVKSLDFRMWGIGLKGLGCIREGIMVRIYIVGLGTRTTCIKTLGS